jgi:transposase-like protein
MRKKTGWCPGMLINQRKKRMAWDDDKKAKAIEMYNEGEPTPENSMEIVKEIAEELEESPNGVRMILTKAGVYIKKATSAPSGKSTSAAKEGSTKVSKVAAFEALNKAITALGQEPNAEIIEKLTGKAAIYFTGVLTAVKGE